MGGADLFPLQHWCSFMVLNVVGPTGPHVEKDAPRPLDNFRNSPPALPLKKDSLPRWEMILKRVCRTPFFSPI